MLGIIFAAYDTTATALSNLLLEISSPSKVHIKQRLQAAVDDIPLTTPLTQDGIAAQMTYAKVCLYESLRREKQVVGAPLGQVINEDFCVPLAAKGADGLKEVVVVPKGYILSFNSTINNHDPNIFDAPESFDPEANQINNKLGTSKEGVARETLGFGLGRHECPGRFFAAEEIQTALVVLFRYLDFCAESDYEPKTSGGVGVNNHPLPVRITLKKMGEELFEEIRSTNSVTPS
mmetsp:Transcript_36808/g.76596  ORF Transcript_36808/g.76596 Transcript_36808/m.76596 type:complete len:234 (-) Transcript_36808:33-734(-)